MARAAIQYRRDGTDWKAVGVWYAVPGALMSRFLPQSGLDDLVRHVHAHAVLVPKADGSPSTWEDFIDFALDGLSNGFTTAVEEVSPMLDVNQTYGRYILGLTGKRLDAYRPRTIPNVTAIHVEEPSGRGVPV